MPIWVYDKGGEVIFAIVCAQARRAVDLPTIAKRCLVKLYNSVTGRRREGQVKPRARSGHLCGSEFDRELIVATRVAVANRCSKLPGHEDAIRVFDVVCEGFAVSEAKIGVQAAGRLKSLH